MYKKAKQKWSTSKSISRWTGKLQSMYAVHLVSGREKMLICVLVRAVFWPRPWAEKKRRPTNKKHPRPPPVSRTQGCHQGIKSKANGIAIGGAHRTRVTPGIVVGVVNPTARPLLSANL